MHGLTKSPIDFGILGGAPWSPANAAPQLWDLDNSKHRSGLVTGWDGVQRKVMTSNESYGTYRPPEPGRCYKFDGVDDYVQFPSLSGLTAFSIAIRAKRFSGSGNRAVCHLMDPVNNDNGWVVYLSNINDNAAVWYSGVTAGAYYFASPSPSTDVWHTAVLVLTGTQMQYFVNGILLGSTALSALPNGHSLLLGSWKGVYEFFIGKQSDVVLFNKALTQAEIDYYHSRGTTGTSPFGSGVIARPRLTEGDGTTAYDSIGNGHHGTIYNATLSTFHATDANITNNDANIRGYSLSGNARVPARNDTTDALGNPLQFTGKCPHPVGVETPGITNHDGTVYLSAPHLTGSETVTSYEGTGVPTVSAGRIDWPSGTTISQIVLSDGTHYVAQEGPGSANTNRTVYDVSGGGNHATLANGTVATIWGTRLKTAADHCVDYGGRIGAAGEFVPGLLSGASAADGNAITLSDGKHGNPFSRLNWNAFQAAEFNGRSIPTSYAPGDTLAVTPAYSAFRRSKADGDDRLLVFENALSGSDLTGAQNYTA